VTAGVFQAFVLCAASVKVNYLGRVDVSSGFFGGSYMLSGTDVHAFDDSAEDFNYIDNSFNAIHAKLFAGINVIYVPQDSSFHEFKRPSTSSANNYIPMSHRINIYGRGLPTGTLSPNSVMVTITKVYATLPTPAFDDIIGVRSSVNELSSEQVKSIHGLVKDNGLDVISGDNKHLLEKFASLNQMERTEVLESVPAGASGKRRDIVLSMIKNYQPRNTRIKLTN